MDVVNSLFVHESKATHKFVHFVQRNDIKKPVYNKNIFKCITSRCLQLDSALSLWFAYVENCLSIDNMVPKEQIFHIKYEDLLDNPEDILTKVVHFCGLISETANIQKSVEGINKERKYAFSQTPKLVELYKYVFEKVRSDTLNTLIASAHSHGLSRGNLCFWSHSIAQHSIA